MIKKAIIPSAFWEDDFYPMNAVSFKESLPVGDVVLVDLLLKELIESEVEEGIFILSEQKKMVAEYLKSFQKSLADSSVKEVKEKSLSQMKISVSLQKSVDSPVSSILRAKGFLRKSDNFAVVGYEEFFLSKEPALGQLLKIFQTAKKPVIGLWRPGQAQKVVSGVEAKVEKIANRLYKIKQLREVAENQKSAPEFLVVQRYIFTPELREALGRREGLSIHEKDKKQNHLWGVIDSFVSEGKVVYGWEIDGEKIGFGSKREWLESFLRYSVDYSENSEFLREWLKKRF